MIPKRIYAWSTILIAAMVLVPPFGLFAGKQPNYVPDKALCAQMLKAGKEYYRRGKYLDAKNYFRKAIQADHTSKKAWRYYEQTVVFALAEKVEKQNDLLVPDVSIRSEVGAGGHPRVPATTITVAPPISPEESAGASEEEVEEEEGC